MFRFNLILAEWWPFLGDGSLPSSNQPRLRHTLSKSSRIIGWLNVHSDRRSQHHHIVLWLLWIIFRVEMLSYNRESWVIELIKHFLNCTILSFTSSTQYFSLIIILFLSEFIVGALVFVFRSGISRALTMDIKDGIVKHYNASDRGGMLSPSVSVIWDRLQMDLQCCGVNSYEDWYNINDWEDKKWVPQSCCRSRHSMSTDLLYEGSGYEQVDSDCRKWVFIWIFIFEWLTIMSTRQKTTTWTVVEPRMPKSTSKFDDP